MELLISRIINHAFDICFLFLNEGCHKSFLHVHDAPNLDRLFLNLFDHLLELLLTCPFKPSLFLH